MLRQIINKGDGESLVRADVATRIFYGVHKRWILRIILGQVELLLNYCSYINIYLKSMNIEMRSS